MTLLIFALILAVPVILIIIRIVNRIEDRKLLNTVTNDKRGTRAEQRLVVSLLRSNIPSESIYHDLYLEYSPGRFSQIDAVVVSPAGLIVFEDKDYSGWIFGKGWQNEWTQVLNYGEEKNRFFNPVKQNEGHIKHLREMLGASLGNVRVISYVNFHLGCELRDVSEIPDGVIVDYSLNLKRNLKKIYAMTPVNYPDIEAIRRTLRQGVRNGRDPEILARHVENVRKSKG